MRPERGRAAAVVLAAVVLGAACGPSAAAVRPPAGSSTPSAVGSGIAASAAGGAAQLSTPSATGPGSGPGGAPALPGPAGASPSPAVPIPGAWSTLGWHAAGTIARAVQLVGAVRWRGLDVVAGLAVDPSGALATGIWTSGDERTWTAATDRDGSFGGAQIERLVAGPSGLVAFGVGRAGCPSSCPATPPVVEWASADGRTWSRSAGSGAFAGARITAAAAGPAGYLVAGAIGGAGAAWASRDGRSWTTAAGGTFGDATLTSVAWVRGTWLIGGRIGGQAPTAGIAPPSTSRAAGWWSTDARTWHAASVAGPAERGATLGSIAVGGGGLVAVGSDMPHPGRSAFAWTSPDGRSWVPAGGTGGGVPAYDVAGNGAQIVALGPGPAGALVAWSSVDGAAWQALVVAGAGPSVPGAPGAAAANGIDSWFALPDGMLAAARPRGGTTSAELPVFVAAGG